MLRSSGPAEERGVGRRLSNSVTLKRPVCLEPEIQTSNTEFALSGGKCPGSTGKARQGKTRKGRVFSEKVYLGRIKVDSSLEHWGLELHLLFPHRQDSN